MKTEQALTIASQSLSITSQLLAIGIEISIIAGGYYIFKTLTEDEPEQTEAPTKKEKFKKIKRIFKAIVE